MTNKTFKVEVINAPERKVERIKAERATRKRKTMLMQTELVSISPSGMLFNALSIASIELSRLNRLAQAGSLTSKDFKHYAILINSLTKLSEENRLNNQQSHLAGLTEQEKLDKVKEAITVLQDTNDE